MTRLRPSRFRWALAAGLVSGALAGAVPAQAEVVQSSATGFVAQGSVTTAASAEEVWYFLAEPAGWWNGEHSWSGDAANLRLEPEAGGCFCEDMPQGGSVEHMRVIYAAPGEMLRMSGALGPLQGEALTGTLTIQLSAAPAGTEVSWTYVVGGHARFALPGMAGPVDMVLSEQMGRLVTNLESAAGPR